MSRARAPVAGVRLQGVDLLRVVAVVAVVLIHTTPLESPASPLGNSLDAATAINQLARFAVPFFFTVAGYFWAAKLSLGGTTWEPSWIMARRVLGLFLVWSVIYLLPTDLAAALAHGSLGLLKAIWWNVLHVIHDPLQTLLTGTESHLWFLPSLWCCLIIGGACAAAGRLQMLTILGITFYVIALVGKPYGGLFAEGPASFNFRNGPFFGLVFFASGHWLYGHERRSVSASVAAPLVLASAGALLHGLEVVWLHRTAGVSLAQDFVLGTYPFGVGMAWLALRLTPARALAPMAQMGGLVLGMYASHMVFVNLLKPWDRSLQGNVLWDLTQIALVLMCSLLVSIALGRTTTTRWMVR
jgi:surface polysaccharide O-acyltransferase-like enzyme